MTAPESIQKLVERFESQRADYKSGRYNETQLRNDFLDPLFEALGWDVNNRKNYSEKYREVVKEASVEVDGAAKAADYAFQSGGNTHFFLEAKKPSVNIETSAEAAFQIRRYAWSKKLALSALSDFEQLAVYDCRQKPSHGDAAHVGRMNLYSCREYVEKWDEIYGLLSYEAVHQGSLDKFLETSKGKRGTADVDDAFLAEMEGWREHLARNIALRNPGLGHREINTSVQLIIDRLIFLRICEDRGIEPENGLRDATDGVDVYGDLMALFRKADKRYNSGLFHFDEEKGQSSHPDKLTPTLKIDDKVFKDILANLYPPKSPYAFKYFSAEILGQVYERFLGKVIRLTEGGHARVEEKPEVRKAGGVYYTPTYIVEYIVRNTLGELLKDKTPADLLLEPLRVLDPACGSGSFLLGAYQYLLDWTLDWYTRHDPARWAKGKNPPIFEAAGGYQLTMEKKKELLTTHIYGVDIDPQAVEVTKLSLLLKVVENPGQLSLLEERILPDLGDNIKCGNSLIGPDYYEGRQMSLLDAEEQYRVNAFDWQSAFPVVFKAGGFDAVIGNPPYVRQEALGDDKQYFQKHYEVYSGMADLYSYFIEKGVSLLAPGGQFSYIVANKWMRANYGKALRKWLRTKCIEEITDFGDLSVFENATTYPCIIRITNKTPHLQPFITLVHTLIFSSLQDYVCLNRKILDQMRFQENGWSLSDDHTNDLINKISESSVPLGEYVKGKIFYGIKTGFNEAFVINSETKQKLIDENPNSAELIKPFLVGRDVKRYALVDNNRYLIFTRHGINIKKYTAIERHLAQFKNRLMPKPKDWKGKEWAGRKPGAYYWYEIQDTVDYFAEFEKPKIIVPAIVQNASYAYDTDCFYSNDKTSIIPTDDLYLFGLLNSKVPDFVLHKIASTKQGGFFEYKPMYISQLPIHTINFSDPTEIKYHDRMVALVESMLALHKQSAAAKLPDEKERLQRQIDITDKQIDKLVYELYGLSEEEIKIVEGG